MSKTGVDLAVLVDVGGDHPGAGCVVHVEDGAFADVDEEPDVLLASVGGVRYGILAERGKGGEESGGREGGSYLRMCCWAPPMYCALPERVWPAALRQQILWPQMMIPQWRQSIGSETSLPVVGQRRFMVSSISVS